eukprot:2594772-Rhodomonas_salina.1
MDFVKDVGDKFHEAIQWGVERKADDASGLRTPNVLKHLRRSESCGATLIGAIRQVLRVLAETFQPFGVEEALPLRTQRELRIMQPHSQSLAWMILSSSFAGS